MPENRWLGSAGRDLRRSCLVPQCLYFIFLMTVIICCHIRSCKNPGWMDSSPRLSCGFFADNLMHISCVYALCIMNTGNMRLRCACLLAFACRFMIQLKHAICHQIMIKCNHVPEKCFHSASVHELTAFISGCNFANTAPRFESITEKLGRQSAGLV